MKEELISFKTAKLAKKKGFTRETMEFTTTSVQRNYYNHKGELNGDCTKHIKELLAKRITLYKSGNSTVSKYDLIASPSQSLLQKWLRETHNIEVNANVNFYNKKEKLGYYYSIDKFEQDNFHDGKDYDFDQMELIGDKKGFDLYEQALEVGLYKALKLI